MNQNTLVFWKQTNTNTVIQVDLTNYITPLETLTTVTLLPIANVTVPPLAATLETTNQLLTEILLTGGLEGSSYGLGVLVTTSARVFQITAAITVSSTDLIPYTASNPFAFSDLIDTIQAGNAAIGTAIFQFPPQIDPSGGYVAWEFMAADGTTYAAGNAYEYSIISNGISNTVLSKSVITVPSSVPPSLVNQKYQLRYTLQLPDTTSNTNQTLFYSYENVSVVGLNTTPLGTQPGVEMVGDPVTLSLVTEQIWDNVGIELYQGNVLVAPLAMITEYERVANGYYWAGVIDSSQLPVSLESYTVVWKYWSSGNSAQIFRESAPLWIVNATIMQVIDDMKAKVAKARTTLYGSPDLIYPTPTILQWLRRGRDAFNGAYGTFTNFDMTQALGVIREYWLLCSEVAALSSQYLAEGEKAFNFSGSAISLEVDRTQYLEAAMSRIQSQLDAELKAIKQNLVIKGVTSGDGSTDPTRLQKGAIGSVGISITPASVYNVYGRYGSGYGLL